jgi:hypothetical protein
MWPIALPETKVVHLLRLAWKRIGCVSKANTSKGWKRLDGGIKRIGCVSAAYPKRIRQRDGNESTAVSSVSVAYRLRIHGA